MTPRTNADPTGKYHPQAHRFLSTLIAATVLLVGSGADAALTTPKCLVLKRQTWSTLRKCQAGEDVKRLKGKPADLLKCQTQFQEKLVKIGTQATKAAIACRYGANGDRTVTDYDTGLMWETKDADLGGFCLISPDPVSHCVIDTYAWADAQAYVSSTSPDGLAIDFPFLAAHSNWRLPTIEELRSIVDTTVVGCGFGVPCIDPIFGPTVANFYWSATTIAGFPNGAWLVNFGSGNVFSDGRSYPGRVRAVRAGL